jgi:hypothetical protein
MPEDRGEALAVIGNLLNKSTHPGSASSTPLSADQWMSQAPELLAKSTNPQVERHIIILKGLPDKPDYSIESLEEFFAENQRKNCLTKWRRCA